MDIFGVGRDRSFYSLRQVVASYHHSMVTVFIRIRVEMCTIDRGFLLGYLNTL
jgi:hypothetical protein